MLDAAIGLVAASILPAIVVVVVLMLFRQLSAARQVSYWSYPIAFAIAYCAGSVIVVRFNAWPTINSDWAGVPLRNWQWMFYLAPLAALSGVIATSTQVPKVGRWIVTLIACIASAWFLTATRSITLPRALCVAQLSIYFIVLIAILESLATRIFPASYLTLLALSAAALAAMVSYYASQTHGQLVAAASASLAACAAAVCIFKQIAPPRGIAVPFAIVIGGWAAVEAIAYDDLAVLLNLPAAPLIVWFILRPLDRLHSTTAFTLQVISVLLVAVLTAVQLRLLVGN